MTTNVKFLIFKSHTRNTNVSVGSHGHVPFINHEAFVEDNKRNAPTIAVLQDYAENFPEMGVWIDPEQSSLEIDPGELAQIQRSKELQVFLADKSRRLDGGNYDPNFKPAGSDVSALTKGQSAPAPRFQQANPQPTPTIPVASVADQAQLDKDKRAQLQQQVAERLAAQRAEQAQNGSQQK